MSCVVPILLLITAVLALRKQEDLYDILLRGGTEGLRILLSIIPSRQEVTRESTAPVNRSLTLDVSFSS